MRGPGLVLIPALLMGCVADSVYYAEGVSVGRRDADVAQCQAQSLAQYPVRTETRFRPPVYVPASQTCDAAGVCTSTAGYFEPAVPYTIDVNRDFRRTAARGCMGDAGYSRIDLPFCEEGQAVRQSTTMPPLASGTCLLRRGGGAEALVVNPAR